MTYCTTEVRPRQEDHLTYEIKRATVSLTAVQASVVIKQLPVFFGLKRSKPLPVVTEQISWNNPADIANTKIPYVYFLLWKWKHLVHKFFFWYGTSSFDAHLLVRKITALDSHDSHPLFDSLFEYGPILT